MSVENYLTKEQIRKLKIWRRLPHFYSIPDERSFLFQRLIPFAERHKSSLVLDVGAGGRPYDFLFNEKFYHSTDLEKGFHPNVQHTYYASAYEIPSPDESYDAVLCMQVLEHLDDPLRALKEIHRLLRPGGSLLISVPQAAGDHYAPYHFFNFTQFGLQSVLSKAGLRIERHDRLAGIFTYLSNRIEKSGQIVFAQYARNPVFRPFLYLLRFFTYGCALLVSKLDFLDKTKAYCIGHVVIARKT